MVVYPASPGLMGIRQLGFFSDVMSMSQVHDGSVANSFNRNLIVSLHSEHKGRKKKGDASTAV